MTILIKAVLMTPPLLELVGTICLVNSLKVEPSTSESFHHTEKPSLDDVRQIAIIERSSLILWCWGWGLIMAGFFGQALMTLLGLK